MEGRTSGVVVAVAVAGDSGDCEGGWRDCSCRLSRRRLFLSPDTKWSGLGEASEVSKVISRQCWWVVAAAP